MKANSVAATAPRIQVFSEIAPARLSIPEIQKRIAVASNPVLSPSDQITTIETSEVRADKTKYGRAVLSKCPTQSWILAASLVARMCARNTRVDATTIELAYRLKANRARLDHERLGNGLAARGENTTVFSRIFPAKPKVGLREEFSSVSLQRH